MVRAAIRGMGFGWGVKIQKLCLKPGMGVGQSLIIIKSPIEPIVYP